MSSNVLEAVVEDPFHQSLASIAEQLEKLQLDADRIRQLYGEAAETNDLTFVKIIEERYHQLSGVLHALANQLHEEKTLLGG